MVRYALGIEYDGHYYRGWQKQKNARSVQAELEMALSKVAGEPIHTICAGRTDAGVHASAQVIHFDTQIVRHEKAWVWGTNTHLSPHIRVLWAKIVPEDFNARRAALWRKYRYILYNMPLRPSLFKNYVSWYYKPLDLIAMQEGANYWLGEHDFSSFRASFCQSKTAIRTVHAINIKRNHDTIVIDVQANAFLYHMVRNMVGVLFDIGSYKKTPIDALHILEAKNRQAASVTAPPQGLYLIQVKYPGKYDIPCEECLTSLLSK